MIRPDAPTKAPVESPIYIMAKRKVRTREVTSVELTVGFYIVDGNGVVKCKSVRSKNKETGTFTVSDTPIRLRTIAAARDFASCIEGAAVLCVVSDTFLWGG